MLPGKKYTPEDMLRLLWRRKWAFIIPFVLVSVGTFAVSWKLPNRYQSEAIMLIVPQKVPESYVRATVTSDLGDRLRSIREQVTTRTRLETIIKDLDLYHSERARMPMEDVVERMRGDVIVQIVKGETFRVAFTSNSAVTAQKVAERLMSEFTRENEQDRTGQASATSEFLESQLVDARKRLAEGEAKVADFQRGHAGQLPSERDSNLQVMHNLQLQVQSLIDSMNRDRDRRMFLERTLAELQPEALPVRTTPSPPGSATPDDATRQAGTGTAAEQLEYARESLKALELRLKPEHPDVLYLKRVIADLEVKAAAEAAAQPTAAAKPSRPRTQEEVNTFRRFQETKEELAAVDIQIASKQAEEKRLREQIASFEGRLAATPGLEAEWVALTRDYDTLNRAYQTLLAKQEDAKMAAALEVERKGESFRFLEIPRVPESPVSPNRFMINLVGTLVGVGLGLGLVALLDSRDKGLRSEDDVLTVLHLPVLAAIPVIRGSKPRRRFGWRRRKGR